MTRSTILLLAGLAAVASQAGCGDSDAGEDVHEHGSVVVTQWNDATELFLEYPHLVAGTATGNWAIHLTDMEDFKPIRSGSLTVRFETGSGVAHEFRIDDVARDGIFLLDPVVERAGRYRVELVLESPQVDSRHVLPRVEVFASPAEVPHAAEEGDGGIAFLKEQQWQIPFAVVPARRDSVRRTIAAPGEIVAPDGALVQVSAPVDGIAGAEANRVAPSVGQSVRRGQVLAILSPVAQEGGFAEVRARVERLEREAARTERLYEAGAVALKRLEETRHDLEVARAQAQAMGPGGAAGDYRLHLASPITGVVAERAFVPGGRVEAGDLLFTIIDPTTAWLRVQLPVSNAVSIPPGTGASFTVEGADSVRRTSRLVSVGRVLDPNTRTVPVTFEVAEGAESLIFGQLARAAVPVGGTAVGVLVPNRSIIDDNGTPVAFVQAGGETFERRVLTLGAGDGRRTHVVSGIQADEMVVTTGAYQVRLASMSGGEFAGGHSH
ncbi:MAG TPA: efflux RND transporter periplasmic adaptor subunit [Gemmatimonadota bacterium]|nr:efflux RND transporter periplasmic adaptor subunit [Gemmatimonadota bacterium]